MGIWSKIVFFVCICIANVFAEPLDEARKFLNDGEINKAWTEYSHINFYYPHYAAKMEDIIRFQFQQKNYLEAWRISELAIRFEIKIENLNYYRMLSAALSGGCPVFLESKNKAWQYLLTAYIYRNPARYKRNVTHDPFIKSEYGITQTHLNYELHPKLMDISKTKIVSSGGCQRIQGQLSDRKKTMQGELFFLASALNELEKKPDPVIDLRSQNAIEMRLFELTGELKDDKMVEYYLNKYSTYTIDDWLNVPEPERRFIWQKLINKMNQTIPKDLAEKIVMEDNVEDVAYWLALLDFDDWPEAKQEKLYKHLLEIKNFPKRTQIMMRLAKIYFDQGKVNESLHWIHRILMTERDESDAEANEVATALGMSIFREYKFDQQILGALQTAFPTNLWKEILYVMMMEHALSGQGKYFREVYEKYSGLEKGKLPKNETAWLEVVESLAERNYAKWRTKILEQKKLSVQFFFLNKLLDFSRYVLSTSDERKKNVRKYLTDIVDYLRGELDEKNNQKFILDLISIYDPLIHSDWQKASSGIQKGVVQAGSVFLGKKIQFKNPYQWEAPEQLPTKDLIVMPKKTNLCVFLKLPLFFDHCSSSHLKKK